MGELIEVKPVVENDEISNLLAKIDSIFVKLKTTNLGPKIFNSIDEVLGRAYYELETSGDERDIEFAKGGIVLAQLAIRSK